MQVKTCCFIVTVNPVDDDLLLLILASRSVLSVTLVPPMWE